MKIRKAVCFGYVLLAFLFSCRKKSVNCGVECSFAEELIFQTGFNTTTLTNDAYQNTVPTGTDASLLTNNSWEGLNNHANIGMVQINYEDGDDSQRIATIVDDPDSVGNKVLQFQLFEPHIKEGKKYKGRVQLNLYDNQCVKEIYQTIRLRFHPDMAYLMQKEEKISWLSIFEFWNNADWTREKFPFRVTVNLFKNATGPVNEMYFHVKGDYKKNWL